MSGESSRSALLRLRGHAIQRIARQNARDTLLGWSIYIMVALALVVAIVLVYNSVRFVAETGLSVNARPFFLPLQAATTLALLYVTLEASLAIARPREQGSLQILFFAPVDAVALIGAHFLTGIIVYVLFLLILLPILLLLTWATNYVIPMTLLWGLLPTLFIAGMTVSFGLFISAAAPSGRSAVLILVAGIVILLALQGGYEALLGLPPTSRYYDALLFLRVILRNVQELLLYVSPFRLVDEFLDAALRSDLAEMLRFGVVALLGTVVWLAAGVWALDRKGVLP